VRKLATSVVLALAAFALGACGTSGASERSVAAKSFQVGGTVTRECPGPIVVGRGPHCMDRAVFVRSGKSWTVHGRFDVRLPKGVYEVTIDGCSDKQRVSVTRRMSSLKLVPHCAIPL
jgi:hypothetical protein